MLPRSKLALRNPTVREGAVVKMTNGIKQKAHITFVLNDEQAEVAFAPHKTLLEVCAKISV